MLRKPHTVFDRDSSRWINHRDEVLAVALAHVKNFACAIDAGAWAGWWTNVLARSFSEVWAIEPVALNAAFARLNNPGDNVHIVQAAVSDKVGESLIRVGGANYGRIANSGFAVQTITLDTIGVAPGFIKLDLEGHDYQGLIGATKTIQAYHPVICVETKDYKHTLIQDFLTENGYHCILKSKPDEVWVWEA